MRRGAGIKSRDGGKGWGEEGGRRWRSEGEERKKKNKNEKRKKAQFVLPDNLRLAKICTLPLVHESFLF